jgi:hypothetical protein
VFSTACDSASITSVVKMAAFQFHLQSGKQRKVGWVGDDCHVDFGQKFPCEEGSVRRCDVMSQKFGANSSHIFTQSLLNFCQDEFFVNNPP